MFNKITLYLKNFDWILFVAVLFLVCFGLIEIYSIALGQNEIDLLNFKKQIFFIAAGLAVLFVFAFWDYYNLRSYSVYIYLFGAALLLGVLFFRPRNQGHQGLVLFMGIRLAAGGIYQIYFNFIFSPLFFVSFFKNQPVKAFSHNSAWNFCFYRLGFASAGFRLSFNFIFIMVFHGCFSRIQEEIFYCYCFNPVNFNGGRVDIYF